MLQCNLHNFTYFQVKRRESLLVGTWFYPSGISWIVKKKNGRYVLQSGSWRGGSSYYRSAPMNCSHLDQKCEILIFSIFNIIGVIFYNFIFLTVILFLPLIILVNVSLHQNSILFCNLFCSTLSLTYKIQQAVFATVSLRNSCQVAEYWTGTDK